MIRNIKFNQYIIIEYINFNIYILNYNNDRSIKILFKHIIFVVNNLKTKMLIDINIFDIENIDFIISARIDYIDNYNIIFKFIIISLSRPFIK